MDPIYLHALMHGELSKSPNQKKNQFDKDLEQEIDRYVNAMNLEEDPSHGFQSTQAHRESIRMKIKEAIKLPELSESIGQAMTLLLEESKNYLSPQDCEKLFSEFSKAKDILSTIRLEETTKTQLQQLCKISDQSMQAI